MIMLKELVQHLQSYGERGGRGHDGANNYFHPSFLCFLFSSLILRLGSALGNTTSDLVACSMLARSKGQGATSVSLIIMNRAGKGLVGAISYFFILIQLVLLHI